MLSIFSQTRWPFIHLLWKHIHSFPLPIFPIELYEFFIYFTCVCYSLSRVRLFVTPRTVAHQASLSMEYSRQEYWSGLPFPSPVDLPDPEIEPGSPALQADSLPSEPPGKPQEEKASMLFQAWGKDVSWDIVISYLRDKHVSWLVWRGFGKVCLYKPRVMKRQVSQGPVWNQS